MDLELSDRVALVAASSSGLGRAVAERLALEGARVMLCSRDLSRVRSAAEAIAAQAHAETSFFACDVTKADEVRALVDATVETFGALDVLVTNAGGPKPGIFTELDDDGWLGAFRLTLLSVVRLIRCALPHLRASGRGRIINLVSTSVKEPIDGLLLSNSLRPGVIGLAKTLAREVAGAGITVNNVCPGRIRTGRLIDLYGSSEAMSRAAEQVPMQRLGEPSDLAPLVAFLAGGVAGYITGQTICVDGGLTRCLM